MDTVRTDAQVLVLLMRGQLHGNGLLRAGNRIHCGWWREANHTFIVTIARSVESSTSTRVYAQMTCTPCRWTVR